MMKHVLPVAVVVGVLSLVACSSLASCDNAPVCIDDAPTMRNVRRANADYSSNPYNLGMFDTINGSARTITRQTAYLTLDGSGTYTSGGTQQSTGHNIFYFSYNFAAPASFDGGYYRGLGYSNYVPWLSNNAFSSVSSDSWAMNFTSDAARFNLLVPSSVGISSVSALSSYFSTNPLYVQYKTSASTTETFEDAINGENASTAYGNGYSDGREDGYNDGFSIGEQTGLSKIELSVNFIMEDTLSSGEVELWFGGEYITGFESPSDTSNWNLELSLTSSNVKTFALVYDDDRYLNITIDTENGGNSDPRSTDVYLPWWEGDVEVYISTSDEPNTLISRAFNLYVDTMSPRLVNVGGTYNAGYAAGYTAGYDEGYALATSVQQKFTIERYRANFDGTLSYSVYVNDTLTYTGTLDYYQYQFSFYRGVSDKVRIVVSNDSTNTPYLIPSCVYDGTTAYIHSSWAVDGAYYLPYWVADFTLSFQSTSADEFGSSLTFICDYSQGIENVRVGYYSIAWNEGYDSGVAQGREAGYDEGYAQGKEEGRRIGYNEGKAAVSEGGLVISNLFGAVVGVPIDVLNGLSGLTIWSIPLISVLMSFMFLGLVLWVIKKFI